MVCCATTAGAQDSFFDIDTSSFGYVAPPYPTSAHTGTIGTADSDGTIQPSGSFAVSVGEIVEQVGGGAVPTTFAARSTNGWAVDSFFDIIYTLDTSEGNFNVDSFFDIAVEIAPVGGGVGSLDPLRPGLPLNDPGRYFDTQVVDSFFDVEYRVDLGTGGKFKLRNHVSVPEGLRVTNVVIGPHNGEFVVDSFFDISYDVAVDGAQPPGTILTTMDMSGTFEPDVVPVDTESWGNVKALFR
jgi:hypothetical protein